MPLWRGKMSTRRGRGRGVCAGARPPRHLRGPPSASFAAGGGGPLFEGADPLLILSQPQDIRQMQPDELPVEPDLPSQDCLRIGTQQGTEDSLVKYNNSAR